VLRQSHKEAFTITAEEGGVIEQIDGAVEIDGRTYLVEMKWWQEPMGRAEVSPHLVSVYGRGDVGGIFISNSGYNPSAIKVHKTALTTRTVIMVELREIVMIMERDLSLPDLLRPKLREAALSKNPLFYPLD
jgi:restriction endonuclease Mrr